MILLFFGKNYLRRYCSFNFDELKIFATLPPAQLYILSCREQVGPVRSARSERHGERFSKAPFGGRISHVASTGVTISQPVSREGWGLLASIKLPSGSDLSIYQPRHPTAYDLEG